MFSFTPNDEQKQLREEIFALFAGADSGKDFAAPGFDGDLWKRLGQSRLPGLAIPKQYGGRGLGALSTVIALESLGYAHPDNGFNFSLAAHLLACMVPLWLYGSEELKEAYLPGLCEGRAIAANAMSEPASGSDAFAMKTMARPTDTGYIVTGTKTFVSNGPIADQVLMYAATDPDKGFMGGISAFWLDRSIHPYTRSEPMEKAGLHNSQLGSLYFEEMPVGRDHLVGSEGRGAHLFNRSMEWERTCLGGLHLGNGHRLIDHCIRDLRTLIQGGVSRERLQVIRFDLAELQTGLEAVRLLTYSTAWKMDQGKPAGREAAMTKWAISDWYQRCTQRIVSIYGEVGMQNRDAEQSLMDALSSSLYSGTSEMQKTIIAQSFGL
ncbi:MAG: acyl-CoA dehydrogenase family protein [Saprospiraceae bacterium]